MLHLLWRVFTSWALFCAWFSDASRNAWRDCCFLVFSFRLEDHYLERRLVAGFSRLLSLKFSFLLILMLYATWICDTWRNLPQFARSKSSLLDALVFCIVWNVIESCLTDYNHVFSGILYILFNVMDLAYILRSKGCFFVQWCRRIWLTMVMKK